MNKGFPKEVGNWNVYAKIPATRTTGTSTETFQVNVVEQGVKTPDYDGIRVDGTTDALPAACIVSDDLLSLVDLDKLNALETYCLIPGYDITNCDIIQVGDSNEFEIYPFIVGPIHFEYSGDIVVYVLPIEEFKSAEITIYGEWNCDIPAPE